MDFKELIAKIETLKSQGETIESTIDYLYSIKIHHTPAIYGIREVFNVKKENVEKLFSEHYGYKYKMNEVNPFNKDFLDIIEED